MTDGIWIGPSTVEQVEFLPSGVCIHLQQEYKLPSTKGGDTATFHFMMHPEDWPAIKESIDKAIVDHEQQ